MYVKKIQNVKKITKLIDNLETIFQKKKNYVILMMMKKLQKRA